MKVDKEKLYKVESIRTLGSRFYRSSKLTSMLIKLNITANQVTFLSWISGLLGVFIFCTEIRIFSIPFFYFYSVLDSSDGWVSRYMGTNSTFGNHLDHLNHGIVTTSLFISIMFLTKQYFLCFLAITLFLFSMFIASHDMRLLGDHYEKIHTLTPQLFLDIALYLGIVFNYFDPVIIGNLLVFGAIFVLSIITKNQKEIIENSL